MAVTKRLGGFSKIHVAKMNDVGGYVAPVEVKGAKSVEAELNYEEVSMYADNAMDYSDFIFNGGSGTLTLTGLSSAEYELLFGSTKTADGVVVKSTDIAPELALLFERKVLGTAETVKYVIYAVKFAPPSLTGETMEGGVNEETVELKFSVKELATNEVFYFINTAEATEATADAWYTAVQKPVIV